MQKELFLKQLAELVKIPTLSSDAPQLSQALALIESWADDSCQKKLITNGKAQILLLGNGDLFHPDVGYLVHVDVVQAKPEQFNMTQEGNTLRGRGVSDMKFSIPIGVELLNQATREGHKETITVAITTDEEVGGEEGGKHLAKDLEFRPKVLIVPDGGDGLELINKTKGVAHVWVEAEGQPAHASQPWLGSNALTPLVRLAGSLLDRYDKNSSQKNWNTTLNIGQIVGGTSVNQVCPQAVLKLDFRFPETRSVEGILSEVEQLAAKIGPMLKVSLSASGDPTYTDVNSGVIRKLMQAAKKVIGKKLPVKGEYGASDARFWANYKIPIIVTKPEGGSIHSDDEWVDLESCLKFYELMWTYINT